jgi:asparagine synthase (glutamine-hydrolysing)
VLSGVGGDEVFGGYRGYAAARRAVRFERLSRWLPGLARASIAAGLGSHNAKVSRLLDLAAGVLPAYHVSRALRGTTSVTASLGGHAGAEEVLPPAALAEYELIAREPSLVRRLAMLETAFYCRNVLLRDADQMGMAHSLEIRVPLLDHELAANAIAALGNSFPSTGVSKPLLVGAVADEWLGHLARLPKQGFTIPLGSWLRAPDGIRALRALSREGEFSSSVFDPSEIDRAISRFERGRESVYAMLSLVVAARWCNRHGVAA